jgi:hypothetical protein
MCLSRSSDFFKLLVKHPFTMGVWPQLIVVSGLSVGIPLMVGFRPQLVVSGLSVEIPLTVGFCLSRSLWLSRSPFTNFPFSQWNFGYDGAFFMNFSFSQWNSGYHEAFSRITMEFWLSRSLSHDKIYKMLELGEDSFHIYHKKYLHRTHLVKNLAS